METWDALRVRRNVRSFTAQPVTPQDLDRRLEAGRRATGSHGIPSCSATTWARPPWALTLAAADLGLGHRSRGRRRPGTGSRATWLSRGPAAGPSVPAAGPNPTRAVTSTATRSLSSTAGKAPADIRLRTATTRIRPAGEDYGVFAS